MSEYLLVLVYGPVLNARFVRTYHLPVDLEALREEEDLKVERPALHVCVEVVEGGIVDDGLVVRAPPQVVREKRGEVCLPHADISSDGHELTGSHELPPRICEEMPAGETPA